MRWKPTCSSRLRILEQSEVTTFSVASYIFRLPELDHRLFVVVLWLYWCNSIRFSETYTKMAPFEFRRWSQGYPSLHTKNWFSEPVSSDTSSISSYCPSKTKRL